MFLLPQAKLLAMSIVLIALSRAGLALLYSSKYLIDNVISQHSQSMLANIEPFVALRDE